MGGIPGKEIWIFRALEPGDAVISLEHTQISGKNTRGIWTYRLAVTVKPAMESGN
jgi:predicted secreted protein